MSGLLVAAGSAALHLLLVSVTLALFAVFSPHEADPFLSVARQIRHYLPAACAVFAAVLGVRFRNG